MRGLVAAGGPGQRCRVAAARWSAPSGRACASCVGVTHTDTPAEARKLAERIWHLRVMDDDDGVMNRSVADTTGAVLVVSQFTLYGDTSRGRRPSWLAAAPPEEAEPLVRGGGRRATGPRRRGGHRPVPHRDGRRAGQRRSRHHLARGLTAAASPGGGPGASPPASTTRASGHDRLVAEAHVPGVALAPLDGAGPHRRLADAGAVEHRRRPA